MKLSNSFDVPLPISEAWPVLLDVQRIAPCMPGAELTEVIDPETYRGKISVRLGPVALTFSGIVKLEEIDHAHFKARLKANGTDAKGRGGAHAVAAFRLEQADGGSRVLVETDLTLSGAVAQYARGVGIVQATAAELMNEFAARLQAHLLDGSPREPERRNGSAAPPEQKSISALSLMARVLRRWIAELFWRKR